MTAIKKNLQEYAAPLIAFSREKGLIDSDSLKALTKILEEDAPGSHKGVIYNPFFYKRNGISTIGSNYGLACSMVTGWNLRRPTVVFDPDMLDELKNSDNKTEVSADRVELLLGNPVYFPCSFSFNDDEAYEKVFNVSTGELVGCLVAAVPASYSGKLSFNESVDYSELDYEKQVLVFFLLIAKQKAGFITSSCGTGFDRDHLDMPLYDFFDFGLKGLSSRSEKNLFGCELIRKHFLDPLLYWLSDMPDAAQVREGIPAPTVRRVKKFGEVLTLPEKAYVRVMGTEIGNAIREYRKKAQVDDPTRTVRPHIRRAHWHTYGTGPGRKTPKLLWLHPIFVHSTEPAKD